MRKRKLFGKEFAMAKKITPTKGTANKGEIGKKPVGKPVTTAVRNTPIPKIAAPIQREATHEMISRRAYEIHLSGFGGDPMHNWLRAERELRGTR
jgi:hypothetical protein